VLCKITQKWFCDLIHGHKEVFNHRRKKKITKWQCLKTTLLNLNWVSVFSRMTLCTHQHRVWWHVQVHPAKCRMSGIYSHEMPEPQCYTGTVKCKSGNCEICTSHSSNYEECLLGYDTV
jgi:hypothetical protein